MIFSFTSWNLLVQSFPSLIEGSMMTLKIALISLLFGLCGGILIGILNCKKCALPYVSKIIDGWVGIVRGTPLFIQLLIIYYVLPEVLDVSFSPFMAGIITLGIHSAIYMSVIIRAGIDAIPNGQWEACQVLGYQRWQALQWIILPQMFRHILPNLTNELTALIKDTSILMIIGVSELTKVSKDIVARELDPMTIYIATAGLYLILTSLSSSITHYIQKRLSYD